ncbi:MAG: serine hydrolase, partial [Bacteriovorax sp.]|nr:serine hydrolase [Bacteriovorax sp.]
NMLYGKGHKNMTDFATAKKIIKEGPGYKWSYSTGTPVITMGILKKIYDPNSYNDMPWRNLFNPLGIKTMTFERDSAGTYIGGAGAFATSRDLAKIGYLYLNHGVWNGNMIVSEEWINKMLTPSPGYISPGTKIKNITDDGVYGGSIWLNKRIKKEFGKPYPYSPEDMYMAVGFMGQLLIILPSQQMIIVRTGYDTAVNSKIDEFVSRAISCFHDPKYPVGREIPAPETAKLDMVKLIRNVKNSIDANTLQATIAKTVCSCHLVSNNEIPVCLKRNNFNFSKYLTKVEVKKNINYEGMISIQVKLSRFARLFKLHYGNSAIAYFNPKQPEYGCTLK